MKISKLIDELNAYKDERGDINIVVQKDSEGNGYSPLSRIGWGWYHAHNTWCGNNVDEVEEVVYLIPTN